MKNLTTLVLGIICLVFTATSAFAGGDKEDYQSEIVHDTILFRETVDTCNCPKKTITKKQRTKTAGDTTKTVIAKIVETPTCKSCVEQSDKDCTLKPLMQPTTLCALENYFDKNCDCNSGQVVLHPRLTEARFIELINNVSSGVFGSVPQTNDDIASMIRQSQEQTVTLKPGQFQFIRIQNCTGELSYDDIPNEMNVKCLVYRDKPWFVLGTGSVLVAKQDVPKIPLDTPMLGGKGNDSNNSFWSKTWKFITDYWWLWLLLLLLFLLLLWLSSKFKKIEEDGSRNSSAIREDISSVATNVQTIKNDQYTESGKQDEFRKSQNEFVDVTTANFAKMQEMQKEAPKNHFQQSAKEKEVQKEALQEVSRIIIVEVDVTIIND
jgi:hypothetical protein